MSEYNYPRFKSALYDFKEFAGPAIGEPMPDFELRRLDGTPVRISDFRGRRLVIETGSATCPMYVKGVRSAAQLAEQFGDARFVLIYVREAHPGDRTPPHETAEAKRALAASLGERYGEAREVLVDSVEGEVHQALGAFPDMAYVLDEEGVVVWRADWMEPKALRSVLSGDADPGVLARSHYPPAKPPPWVAIPVLLLGGWKGLWDFVLSLPGLLRQHREADIHHGIRAR